MIKQTYLSLNTKERRELINITDKASAFIKEIGGSGLLNIYIPHTTAGILINEDEEGLKRDLLGLFEKLVPESGKYYHNIIDNNADAHQLSVILKNSVCLPFSDGRLLLGTWQSIFFVELDGPRNRQLVMTALF